MANSPPHRPPRSRPKTVLLSFITNPLWWWLLDKTLVILVVGDDATMQHLVAERLKSVGYEPVVFNTAEKAHEALSKQPTPALIILDMLLPGMSGIDFVRVLKQKKEWETIPVVVVSVLSQKDEAGS